MSTHLSVSCTGPQATQHRLNEAAPTRTLPTMLLARSDAHSSPSFKCHTFLPGTYKSCQHCCFCCRAIFLRGRVHQKRVLHPGICQAPVCIHPTACLNQECLSSFAGHVACNAQLPGQNITLPIMDTGTARQAFASMYPLISVSSASSTDPLPQSGWSDSQPAWCEVLRVTPPANLVDPGSLGR